MKLRQLFENVYEDQDGEYDGSLKTIGICYGRWNPPHKGHKEVWKGAASNPIWYVGTNQNTEGPKDPLPYDVKLQIMGAVWPKVAGHVIPEQDLFVMATHIYEKYGQNVHLKVYTDETWLVQSLQKYNGQMDQKHGGYRFNQIDWVETKRLARATDLRAAVRNGDRSKFYKDMGISPNTLLDINGQQMTAFDVVAHYLNKYPEKVKKEKSVAEAYDGFGKFDAAEFSRHMDKLRAREELKKTDPVRALVGDLIDKEHEKERLAKRKKPDDDSVGIHDPRHPGYAYSQGGHTHHNVDEIAGAFPTPSAQQAMYKAAAQSNAAEAKRQAELKAQADAERLKNNTAEVEKQQRVNHHAIPTNESFADSYLEDRANYLAEVAMRMQGSSKEEKEANARAKALEAEEKAKHLAIVQAYVKIMAAGQPLPPKMQQSYNTMPDFRKEVDAALKNIPGQPGVVDLEQRRNYHLMPKNEGVFDSKPKTDWNARAKSLFAKGFNEQQVRAQLLKDGCPVNQVDVYVQGGQLEETPRMSAAVKLQRAWEREQAKSAASRQRGQELLNPPKKEEPTKTNEACWKKYKQIGMKKKSGKRVPNCVPKESLDHVAKDLITPTGREAKKYADFDAARQKRRDRQEKDAHAARANRKYPSSRDAANKVKDGVTISEAMSELHSEIADHLDRPIRAYKVGRMDADHLGDYCVRLAHLLAKKLDLDYNGIQHLVNQYVEGELDSDMIAEGGMKKIDKTQKAAMKNATTFPGLNMNLGNGYTGYRFGLALAGAPEFPTKADNWIAGDPLLSPYTDEEAEMINYAAKQVGGGKGQKWSNKRSQEIDGVNTTSTIAKPKKNQYGV